MNIHAKHFQRFARYKLNLSDEIQCCSRSSAHLLTSCTVASLGTICRPIKVQPCWCCGHAYDQLPHSLLLNKKNSFVPNDERMCAGRAHQKAHI